jgi:Protein of unknown function (DUF2806)
MTTWLDFINSIPGLAKAVTELVGDASRIGSSGAKLATAKIGQKQAAIEDQTNRDTALSNVITKADVAIATAIAESAVEYIKSQGPVFGERALSHGIHRMIKQQANLEAVVIKTINTLEIAPPDTIPPAPLSDDWLNLFGQYAENATSEKMQEHWAHILAGEIKNPGSFSFITLHLASVLDAKLAAIIEKLRPWILDGSLPLISLLSEAPNYSEIVTLAGIGFVSLGTHQLSVNPVPPNVNVVIELEAGSIIVPPIPTFSIGNSKFHEHHSVGISSAVITPAGRELMRILPEVPQAKELPERLMDYIKIMGFKDLSFETKMSIHTTMQSATPMSLD